jgi:hypothetical protein
MDEARGRLIRAEASCSRLALERDAMEEGVQALAREAAKRLEGRDLSDWREDLERCLDRERKLQQVADILEGLEKAGTILTDLNLRLAALPRSGGGTGPSSGGSALSPLRCHRPSLCRR